jgi:hypothetical protein
MVGDGGEGDGVFGAMGRTVVRFWCARAFERRHVGYLDGLCEYVGAERKVVRLRGVPLLGRLKNAGTQCGAPNGELPRN